MTDQLSVVGIECFGHHGVFDHERRDGQRFVIDLTLGLDTRLAAATRITHTELLQSRRDAARDRAEQAQAYRELTDRRTAEHAEFSAAMTARVDRQEVALSELEVALSAAQKRAAEATLKFNAEARRAEHAENEGRATTRRLEEAEERAAEAALRVSELEQEIDVLRAEVTAWEQQPGRMHA